jgi:hypothetical protein
VVFTVYAGKQTLCVKKNFLEKEFGIILIMYFDNQEF